MSTVESREYEDALPGWLNSGAGRDFIDSVVLVFDAFSASLQDVRYGIFSASPPYDAVPHIANDRVMFRGFFEPIKSFMGRAYFFRQKWRSAGMAATVLRAVAGVWGPDHPKMRLVWNFGWLTGGTKTRWVTLNEDGTIERHTADPANWDWDGVNLPHRAWLIIYAPSSLAEANEGIYGNASKFGETGVRFDGVIDKKTIGSKAFAEYVERTRAALDAFKPASVLHDYIIIAFDPDSFDPTSAPGSPGMPDGSWGRDKKQVGGTSLRGRLASARYWKGV